MRKSMFVFIFIGYLGLIVCRGGIAFGQTGAGSENQLYNDICTQGLEGYGKFRRQFGGKTKSRFWAYFDNIIRDFNDKKQFLNILECSAFWKHLQDDDLFDFDANARADRPGIKDIFAEARENYKQKPRQAMASLEPVDIGYEYTPGKIKRYTADRQFANIVKTYADNYEKIQTRIHPKGNEISLIRSLLNRIDKNHPIDTRVKARMDNYINQWAAYYRSGSGGTYAEKETASRKQKNQLQKILDISQEIHAFGINGKPDDIEGLIAKAQSAESNWRVHKEVDAIVSNFESKHEPTLQDLYSTAGKIFKKAGRAPLESSLYTRVQLFLNIPGQPTIDSLENYLETRWNRGDNVVRLLKDELAAKLSAKLERQINAGGNSLAGVLKVKKTADKYNKYFNSSTSWDDCIVMLRQYYWAKENNNYPELLALYQGNSTIKTACNGVFNKWKLMKTRRKVEERFIEYYKKQADKVLGDRGKKYKPDFSKFVALNEQVGTHLDKELSGKWETRYNYLKTYFSGNYEEKDRAAAFLHHYFPGLAKSYSIKKPTVALKELGSGTGPVQSGKRIEKPKPAKGDPKTAIPSKLDQSIKPGKPEADYRKLEEMWKAVEQMKTSQQAAYYIENQAPLRTAGAQSAEQALDTIYMKHDMWKRFAYAHNQIGALAMIARMYALCDYPLKQKEIYNYLLAHWNENDLKLFSKNGLSLNHLRDINENNILYLRLYDARKANKELKVDTLDSLERNIIFNLLTLEQQIQAHYMLGRYYEQSPVTNVPPCYHFGKALQLMNKENISKIYLSSYKGVQRYFQRDDLKEKVCRHCKKIEKGSKAAGIFEDRYKSRGGDIDAFIQECTGDVPHTIPPKPGYKKSVRETPGPGSRDDRVSKFLEMMFTFVKQSRLDDQDAESMCRSFVYNDLSGPVFDDTKKKYRKQIPEAYDLLMNRFFHLIYVRKGGWPENAEKLIGAGAWPGNIKNKMKEYLKEMKRLFK